MGIKVFHNHNTFKERAEVCNKRGKKLQENYEIRNWYMRQCHMYSETLILCLPGGSSFYILNGGFGNQKLKMTPNFIISIIKQ
jgi:hypothetical protein